MAGVTAFAAAQPAAVVHQTPRTPPYDPMDDADESSSDEDDAKAGKAQGCRLLAEPMHVFRLENSTDMRMCEDLGQPVLGINSMIQTTSIRVFMFNSRLVFEAAVVS